MNSTSVRQKHERIKAQRLGIVYLLHFSEPLGNPINNRAMAQHYCGWTDDIRRRLPEHRNGWGAAITSAAVDRGISLHLVRIWPGPIEREKEIKRGHNLRRLCPICCQSKMQAVQLPLPFIDLQQIEIELLQHVPWKPKTMAWAEIQALRENRLPASYTDEDDYSGCDIPF